MHRKGALTEKTQLTNRRPGYIMGGNVLSPLLKAADGESAAFFCGLRSRPGGTLENLNNYLKLFCTELKIFTL